MIFFNSRKVINDLLSYEVIRFLLVGLTTVCIDLICYLILIFYNFEIFFSKGVSFILGSLFAFFANRSFTFKNSRKGFDMFFLFFILYLLTLVANVWTNEIVLDQINQTNYSLIASFIIATIFSASLNFLGMKYIVFSSSKGKK